MPKPNYKLKKFLTCISSGLATIYEEQDSESSAKNDSE
jgi:hypothetical protein